MGDLRNPLSGGFHAIHLSTFLCMKEFWFFLTEKSVTNMFPSFEGFSYPMVGFGAPISIRKISFCVSIVAKLRSPRNSAFPLL